MHEAFWIVWMPAGARPPSYRHDTEASAIAEAERLARNHPDSEAFVLRTTHRSIRQTVHTEPLLVRQRDCAMEVARRVEDEPAF